MRAFLHRFGRARNDHLAAVNAGTRSQVDHVVCRKNSLLIVFDHNDRIADIPEMGQRAEQALVVALVQPDRRLVEDIHDTDEARTDLWLERGDTEELTAPVDPGSVYDLKSGVDPDQAAPGIDQLHREGSGVSKATVYNCLKVFSETGLVKEINVDGTRKIYDSTTHAHHHFYHVDTGELTDIPDESVRILDLPPLPNGTEQESIEVLIRVRDKK